MGRALPLVLAFCLLSPAFVFADDAAQQGPAPQQPSAAEQARAAFYNASLQPLFKKYCFDCHSGSEPEAELSIERLQIERFSDDSKLWEKVSRMLDSGDMPPADAEQPPAQD